MSDKEILVLENGIYLETVGSHESNPFPAPVASKVVSFMGKKIKDMTRDELIKVVEWSAEEIMKLMEKKHE